MKKIAFILFGAFMLQTCERELIENYIVQKQCDGETYLISNSENTVYLICNDEELNSYQTGDMVSVKVKPTKYNCKYAQYGCSNVYYQDSKPASIIRFK
ncbi:MAG: hypothetical protein LRY27_02765 [Chitinophagales bacterium]|nr:hypothetical protein [Chitinophagales bacterium]